MKDMFLFLPVTEKTIECGSSHLYNKQRRTLQLSHMDIIAVEKNRGLSRFENEPEFEWIFST